MSYSPAQAPPPPARPRRAITVGPAVTVLGVGVTATSLFGLPLASQSAFAYDDYSLIHSYAGLVNGGLATDLFKGIQFWWIWGQLTFGIVLLVLTVVLLAGVAQRPLGIVLAALAVVFGIVEVIALSRTPTAQAIQQLETNREKLLGHATYGTWFGLLGVIIFAAGALITALQAHRRAPAAASYPVPQYPPTAYPPLPQPSAPYRPANDPPVKRL